MAVPHPHIRFNYEDYKTLPESMSARYELLDGVLIMVPALTPQHQRVSRNLGFILMRFQAYTLIDTGGVRRRSRVDKGIEKFSVIKILQAVEKAHVVVLMMDAREGIVEQDATFLNAAC